MIAASERNAPKLRIRTPQSTAEALRQHFFRHNVRVVLLTIGTIIVSAAGWLLLYMLCTWFYAIVEALGELPQDHLPPGFRIVFFVAVVCSLIYVWVDQRLTPNERVADKKSPGEIAADFLLAIPRMTFSVAGTLSAWQRLEPSEYVQAAALLHRIGEEKRVPMSGVRLDIPDPDSALRILFALQLTQVIEVHRDERDLWLKLSASRPASLRLGREGYADA